MAWPRTVSVDFEQRRNWSKILISGHSFARRLSEFLIQDKGVSTNFRLGECELDIFGKGGLKFQDWARNLGHTIASFGKPELIIMMIGDNDISFGCSAEEISSQILAFLPLIQGRFGVQNVILCQLMPRFPSKRYSFNPEYNASAKEVNKLLRQGTAHLKNVLFWEHDFIFFPEDSEVKYQQLKNNFLADGVHLAPSGHSRLYKSLRKAITHSRVFL